MKGLIGGMRIRQRSYRGYLGRRSLLMVGLLSAMTARVVHAGAILTRSPRVVDSAGKAVGTVVGGVQGGDYTYTVMRREGDSLVVIPVNRAGIPSEYVQFLHESSDCSGTRLIAASAGTMAQLAFPTSSSPGVGVATIAYYAGTLGAEHVIRAFECPSIYGACSLPECAPTVGPYCCIPVVVLTGRETQVNPAAPALSFDVSGFVPPFKIK